MPGVYASNAGCESLLCEITLKRIFLQGEDFLLYFIKDLRMLRSTQKKAQEANSRLQLMLDGLPVACYLLDKNAEPIDCNREVLTLFDFTNFGCEKRNSKPRNRNTGHHCQRYRPRHEQRTVGCTV